MVGLAIAQRLLNVLLLALPICPIDAAVIVAAQQLGMNDCEDAVQLAAAQAAGLDPLATRNVSDYRGSSFTILLHTFANRRSRQAISSYLVQHQGTLSG